MSKKKEGWQLGEGRFSKNDMPPKAVPSSDDKPEGTYQDYSKVVYGQLINNRDTGPLPRGRKG